jgi:hypothetical protein
VHPKSGNCGENRGAPWAGHAHHGPGLVEVDSVRLEGGFLCGFIWIPAVNFELLVEDRLLCNGGCEAARRGGGEVAGEAGHR